VADRSSPTDVQLTSRSALTGRLTAFTANSRASSLAPALVRFQTDTSLAAA
jgi:hypothetical protein